MARTSFLKSTIGKKQLVGLTGLALSLFLLTHVLGNFLIFLGPEAYNKYGHALVSNPFIYLAEAGLVGAFLLHLALATKISLDNKMARPVSYAVNSNGEKGTSHVTKAMWYQGVVILVFAVLHLITFKYGTLYDVTYDGEKMRDLYRLVEEVFAMPEYVVGYVIAMIILGLHLSHGLQSCFRTLGFNHPAYEPKIKQMSYFLSSFIACGFISQPVYIYIFQ